MRLFAPCSKNSRDKGKAVGGEEDCVDRSKFTAPRLYGSRNIWRKVRDTIWACFETHEAYPARCFEKSMMTWCYTKGTFGERSRTVGRVGIQSEVKVLVCLRLLGSETSLRQLDDSACMSKGTIRSYFKKFCKYIKDIYGPLDLN